MSVFPKTLQRTATVFILFLSGFISRAFGQGIGGNTSGTGIGGNTGTPGIGGNTGTGEGRLINPLESKTIEEFLLSIIDVLLTFAIPIIIFFIMYGGFKLVTARGDTSQIEDGKRAITWAVVGGVIVLGAKLIIEVIQGTVDKL